MIFTILAFVFSLVLHAAGWPWLWAIVAGIGASFLVTTIGGYAIMFLMALRRRAKRLRAP